MYRYKALITDFDNTLVSYHDPQVDPLVEKEIRLLVKNNIHFSIATGRPYYGMINKTVKGLGLTSPQIVHGGAEIIDPTTNNVIWSEYIPDDEVRNIINDFAKEKIYFAIELEDTVYSPDAYRLTFIYGEETKFRTLNELHISQIPKIIVPAFKMKYNLEQATEVEQRLTDKYKNLHVVKILTPSGYGLDITSIKATKHLAVLEYLKLLNLNPKEVIGVGDGYNDYPLLTACGTKVAMADAPQALKDIADFIAPPQKENGLLKVFKKYFC